MYAFSQTTGLGSDKIKEYLTYGSGPKLDIIPGSNAYSSKDHFHIGADIINHLGSINSHDNETLGEQAFGTAMALIDELSHVGDMQHNNTNTSTGTSKNNPGIQNWRISPTFHRGGDSQLFGFGVAISVVSNAGTNNRTGESFNPGQIVIQKPSSHAIKSYSPNLPVVPAYNREKNIQLGHILLK